MGKDADSDPLSAGPMLREARESRGLSVFEVAEKLFLTEHYVNALESESYEKLPGEVYVKGYIKSYALLLDLDKEQVMDAYRQPGAPAAGETGHLRAAPANPGRKWALSLLLVLLAGALAAAAWWAFQIFGADAGFLAAGAAKRSAK